MAMEREQEIWSYKLVTGINSEESSIFEATRRHHVRFAVNFKLHEFT